MDLFLVRHGQTIANETNTIQGQSNTPLSEQGWKQVHAVAKYLSDVRFDSVFSSDLDRAMDTARTIAPYADVIPDKRLREWALGQWQGLTMPQVKQKFPEELAAFLHGTGDFAVTGGESKSQVRQRVSDFMKEIAASHKDETVLVVSHCGAMRSILSVVLDCEGYWQRQPQIDNCSVSRFAFREGLWQLLSWNSADHIQNLISKNGNY